MYRTQKFTLKILASVFALLIMSMSVVSAANLAFTYDLNGNLIQDNDFVYEYNDWNQMIRMRLLNGTILSEYSYDNEGNRYKKVEYFPGGTNETTYYGNENFIQVRNSSGTFETFFYYEDDTLVARKDPNGSVYYYHPDHLGSTDVITTSGGAVFEDMDYLPFGDELVNSTSRYLYTGKELDRESDLDYFDARYYSPYLKQFIQPDTIIPDVYNPQSLNRYAYVLNNPMKYTDPSGKWAVSIDAGFGGTLGIVGIGPTGSLVLSRDPGTGQMELGLLETTAGGVSYGLGGEASIGASYTSNAKSINQLRGTGVKKGASVAVLEFGASVDVTQSSSDSSIKTYSVAWSPGAEAEEHTYGTYTEGPSITVRDANQNSQTQENQNPPPSNSGNQQSSGTSSSGTSTDSSRSSEHAWWCLWC